MDWFYISILALALAAALFVVNFRIRNKHYKEFMDRHKEGEGDRG